MNVKIKIKNDERIAVITGDLVIQTVGDVLDLMAHVYYELNCNGLVIEQEQLHPDFFDLKTGFAGELLQKFTNYRMKIGIVGDFTHVHSKSLQDFIFESNKKGHVVFAPSPDEAIHLMNM